MSLNFKINNKSDSKNKEKTKTELKTEIIEYELEDDDDDEVDDNDSHSSSKSGSSELVKFLIKVAGIIIGIILVILLITFIMTLISGRNYSYEKIESIMKNAAVSYFKDHPENLPTDNNNVVITDTTLVQSGKMKELSEYTKKGVVCNGKVTVIKSGNDYMYMPNLSCGDDYTTNNVVEAILKDNEVVTEGYGLYKNNDGYIFRGEKVNNYLVIDKKLWRVLKIDSANDMYLVSENQMRVGMAWDDRYNENKKYAAGINNYGTSRIKEQLESIYNKKLDDSDVITENIKSRLLPFAVCSGARDINDSTSNSNSECSTTVDNQKIGLLTVSDYIAAGVDSNCTTIKSKSCQNYNYLASNYAFWLATSVKNTTSDAFFVSAKGNIESDICNKYNYIKPVIKISSCTVASSGNGTEENPYIIK